MNLPSDQNETNAVRNRDMLKSLPNRIWKTVSHNWSWKLLALILAVCLWAGLISQDSTLTRERTFTDVSVSVTGADSLKRNNGLIVISGIDDSGFSVRMRADVPQNQYSAVTAANYNPRIDLSKITAPGEQTVRVLTSSSTLYGSVQSISPDTVSVVVDEYVSNYRVPISVKLSGEYPNGLTGSAVSLDPSTVTLSGPKSIVDRVVRIYVDYDISKIPAVPGKARTALPMRFVDKDGETVKSELLEVTSAEVLLRTVIAEQTIYPVASKPVTAEGQISGIPAKGYAVTGFSVSPSEVSVAAVADVLSVLEQISTENVDVSGKSASFTQNVRLRKTSDVYSILPENVAVSVSIEPVSSSRSFSGLKISAVGNAGDQSVSIGKKSASAILHGEQAMLDALKNADLTVFADVSGLEPGTYSIPLQLIAEGLQTDSYSYILSPESISVTIK